jgi:hypothetical protein
LPSPTPEEIAKKAAEEAAQKKAEAVDAAAKLEAADAAAKAVAVNSAQKEVTKRLCSNPLALEENSIHYEQKNYSLKIKLTKNGQPCLSCVQVASEYEIAVFKNGEVDHVFFNCKTCLFQISIPDYQNQGAEIGIIAPEPPEEAS